MFINEYGEIELYVFLLQMMLKRVITEKQQYVLIKKYFYDYSDEKIAQELKVSRQAINKINNRALDNVYKYIKDVV